MLRKGMNGIAHSRMKRVSRLHSTMRPAVWKQLEDLTAEVEIEDEELCRYTRHRWLTPDENAQLNSRFRRISVAALCKVATQAVNNGSSRCVKILKYFEGSYNKAMLMTMDNGADIVLKIPNPNAGPHFFTVASQVATQKFVGEILGVPVPRILSYSVDSNNPIHAEYVIEEKADGVNLSSVWHTLSTEGRQRILMQLISVERKLFQLSFRCHGSLYIKHDLLSRNLSVPDLHAPLLHPTSRKCDHESLKDYAIGPLATAAIWDGERAEMPDLDTGPWKDASSYITALGTNERSWARRYAKPRLNPFWPSGGAQSPSAFISLLDRYLELVPYLAPKAVPALLSHPDLHLGNIFVDPEKLQITALIDWQSSSIREPYFEPEFPRLLAQIPAPALSDGADSIDQRAENEQTKSESVAGLRAFYEAQTRQNHPWRWRALQHPHRYLFTDITSSITGAWERDNAFALCHRLIAIASDWEADTSHDEPCPIQFSPEELAIHRRDLSVVGDLAEVLEELERSGIIPNGGKVATEDYDRALEASRRVKEWFVSRADDKAQQDFNSKVWPFVT